MLTRRLQLCGNQRYITERKTYSSLPSLCVGYILQRILQLLVFSIVNEEPNAEECKAKIKAYEEAHRTEIVIRQSQRADEERAIQDRIAAEQRESERRKREYQEEEKAIALNKRKFKQEKAEVLLGVSALSLSCDDCIVHLSGWLIA